jgi:hypothetical protein
VDKKVVDSAAPLVLFFGISSVDKFIISGQSIFAIENRIEGVGMLRNELKLLW